MLVISRYIILSLLRLTYPLVSFVEFLGECQHPPQPCVALLGNTHPTSPSLSSSSDVNAYGPRPSYITNPGGSYYPSTATVSTAGA